MYSLSTLLMFILRIIRKILTFVAIKTGRTMEIEFKSNALEELYIQGSTKDGQYKRLSKDIIKRYVKVVNYLKSVPRLEDLFLIKSLHYEKKKGSLKGVDAVWINDQYRLLFYSSPDESGIIVNALLFEISKHYE